MTKHIYPEIANISYKSKTLTTNVSVRIRMFQLREFTCPVCKAGGTQSDFAKWCKEESELIKERLGLDIIRANYVNGRTSIPEFLTDTDEKLISLCPRCYVNHFKIRLVETHVDLIKLFTSANPEFIQHDKIATQFLYGRWKSENTSWGFSQSNPKYKASIIVKNMEEAYDVFEPRLLRNLSNHLDKDKKPKKPKKKTKLEQQGFKMITPCGKIKRGTIVKIKLNTKITIEQLKDDWEKYEQRKFLRKL